MIKRLSTLGLALALAFTAYGQNRTSFGGNYNAIDYAYGITGQAPAALQVATGTTSTGAGTLTLVTPGIVLGDGTTVYPLSTVAPITVGSGSTQETVTPTALSNCNYPAPYATCKVTATFTYTHGTGENVTTGSYGLQEAVNAAYAAGGGAVTVSPAWGRAGGTSTIITAAYEYSTVWLQDLRGVNNSYGNPYWTMQPSTLASLAVPTTLTATTVVFTASPVGTWAAAATYFCVTYVDALGGEGPCSATYNQTPTVNYSLNITSPEASTGAVGYRVYAGTGSLATAYLLPITSSNCTLTTLETVMPACAIGANAVFPTTFATTSVLKPNTQAAPTVNVYQSYPQGHTTFAYQPSGSPPIPFQAHYGPFVAYGSTTSGQIDVLGTVNLPTGYLNFIGRTIRVSGKIAATVNTAAVPTVTLSLGWVAGTTSGAPVAVCTNIGAAYGSSAAYNLTFTCTITTNAAAATAIGTVMTDGTLTYGPAAGTAAVVTIDTGTAAIASLGLMAQNSIYVLYTSGTNTTSAVQLLDLHVETL